MKTFIVPWTLSDENEFGVFSWYVTTQELGLVVLATMASYLCMAPVLGTGLVNILLTIAAGASLMQWMVNFKKGKPASWMWDARLGFGMLPQKRGLMRVHRGVQWYSQKHVARPCAYLAGAKKAGEDLSIATPWMEALPPATDWSPLMPPRRRRVYSSQPSTAPLWFRGANGFHNVVTPRIPWTVKTVVMAKPG